MSEPLHDITSKFKTPRQTMDIESSEDSDTEIVDVEMEEVIRDETKAWLSLHGPKLFGLEASKFNAQEAKRKNIRGVR